MYIYSEILGKKFDTVAACEKAEKEYAKQQEEVAAKKAALTAQRQERAKEIEQALAECKKAEENYLNLLKAFCKDYGSYHYSTSDGTMPFLSTISKLFTDLF